ncbi:MAG: molybdopterin-dependent oxidoreductase [Proteobacteria bacterium]|nr:molybdopterin-dependent oxidoreductase [Pseudomonadota bacterium]MCP4918151.1 molybdopterin-dependent oxidoreductase [Pseudomonadota bacterium]
MTWKPTACFLCSINCGLQVQTEGRHLTRIRGDKGHPGSRGYVCEKPQRLDRYQNAADRLDSPLRRCADGTFERVTWDVAISTIARKLLELRGAHGGEALFYYGGGGQGNHLGGSLYGRTLLEHIGAIFSSNALAQEKTGEFWVDSRLFGKARCHTTGDYPNAEVAVFVGKNPWQSHGFPRARVVLRQIARDPDRLLVVIDPKVSETAAMADVHLRVRPGTDAFLLSAMVAVLFDEDLLDQEFVGQHTNGVEALEAMAQAIDISANCVCSGVDEETVRSVVRRMARARGVSIFEDLGIQQAPNSTLNSYLEKLLFLLTGSFGVEGGMNLHTGLGSLGGSRHCRGRVSPVTQSRLITGLVPCNAIPDEILTDHPDRFRAMIVESANPVHSLADSPRMREAMRALDFSVVIDVAMTETAREADWVLPATSQLAKWECSFFTLEFPHNVFHLRPPVLEPLPGTLPEPEIHSRLLEAMGALDGIDLEPLRAAAAQGPMVYGMAFMQAMGDRRIRDLSPVVLYRTMGPLLPDGADAAAALLLLAQRCAQVYPRSVKAAGIEGDGPMLALNLFRAMFENPSGFVFSHCEYDETLKRLETPDKKVHLVIGELLQELATLDPTQPPPPSPWPLILAAGERRSSTSNTIYRDPAGRASQDQALRVSPDDAQTLGLATGDTARLTTKRGQADVLVEVSDRMLPGHIALPNGQGLSYDGGMHGVAPNELTSGEDQDWLAGTPWHKHVRARLEALPV